MPGQSPGMPCLWQALPACGRTDSGRAARPWRPQAEPGNEKTRGTKSLRQYPAFSSVDLFDPLPGDPRGNSCAAHLTRRRLEYQLLTREFEEAFLRGPDVIGK